MGKIGWCEAAALLLIFITIAYRCWLLCSYGFAWTDHDQALLWDAASAAKNGFIPEPCFWGQAYGSTLEAFLAVPLLLVGVPHNMALPIVSTIIGWLPFGVLAFSAYRMDHKHAACLMLASYLLMSWHWDILTTIPRSLTCGFPFAIGGALLVNTRRQRSNIKVITGFALCGVGIALTASSALIVAVAVLWFLLCIKEYKQLIGAAIAGLAIAAVPTVLMKAFYAANPAYNFHPPLDIHISFSTLCSNLSNLIPIAGDFIFVGVGTVPLVLIMGAFIYLAGTRRVKGVILFAAMILMMLLLLSLPKTTNFQAGTVLYSQLRMLLVFPSCFMLTALFCLDEKQEVTCSGNHEAGQVSVNTKSHDLLRKCFLIALAILSATAIIWKGTVVQTEIANPQSPLFEGRTVVTADVTSIEQAAHKLKEAAVDADADVVVLLDNKGKVLSYAFEALYYGDYLVCVDEYERRTWTYEELCKQKEHRVLFVKYLGNGSIETNLVEISNDSVANYIKQAYAKALR